MTETLAAPVSTDLLNDIVKAALKAGADAAEAVSADRRSLSVGVRKGTLSVATGKIAKRAPESVDFHTPTAVLGVRGTEFVVEVIGGRDE